MADIRLFRSHPHDCGYFSERQAQDLVVDPEWLPDTENYSLLSQHGFRRSGSYIYQPKCNDCNACIASRIPVKRFQPNRSQKRCLKTNIDCHVNVAPAKFKTEHLELYNHYQSTRHSGGSMENASEKSYQDFLFNAWADTQLLEIYNGDKLLAVAVTDVLVDGLSAIYTFFDPEQSARSLGKLAVLQQIAMTQALNKDFLYLGYWIAESNKMRYKTDYRPIQLLQGSQWCEYQRNDLLPD